MAEETLNAFKGRGAGLIVGLGFGFISGLLYGSLVIRPSIKRLIYDA